MRNIFLIGFMGCGKSTVASYMAEQYKMEVVEMDEVIAAREGMSIPQIFEAKGEPYFRNAETKLLEELGEQQDKVVSCGGGAVLREQNVAEMKKSGLIVLLTASPETILERVKDDENRPLLQGNKNAAFIADMMEKRRPKYEAASDAIIRTDGKSAAEISREILEKAGK